MNSINNFPIDCFYDLHTTLNQNKTEYKYPASYVYPLFWKKHKYEKIFNDKFVDLICKYDREQIIFE